MSATLAQLLAVRSHFADDVDAYCKEAIRQLDSTGFSCKGKAGDSAVISISRTGVDARVFTAKKKLEDKDRDRPDRSEDRESAPATARDAALADLDEHPWLAAQRECIPWSRALADAKKGQPLVIRGAPGSGKTTLSRFSTVKRLDAVRAALADHTRLPEDCEPMLWLTCSDLAQAKGNVDDPADLVISGAFLGLRLPAIHPATSPRVRAWLRARIAAGCCPVVLDSLDEVDAKDEAAFRDRAPRLLHLGSPLLLTCRVLEWEERRKWTGWLRVTEIEMAPLNRREQHDYTRRFFLEEIKRPDSPDLLAGIERQLAQKASLRKACESPILLCFACLLHAEGELSGAMRRTDLYQRMRRRLFRGEWRGLPHPPEWADGGIRERRVTTWLCEIALALFRAAPEAKIFSFKAWEDAVGDPAAMAAAAKISPPVPSDTLPDNLAKCGFLVALPWRDDQPQWSFQHRSFVAYLAGAALAERPREVWLKEVIAHLWFQPAWEDVILFLAGHLDEAGTDALLDAVERQPEDIFRQRLHWQWRIAGEAKLVPPKWGRAWVDAPLKLAMNEEDFCPGREAREALLRALGAMSDAMPELLDDLLPRLDPAHESDRDVRWRVTEALGQIGGGRALNALLPRIRPAGESDSGVRENVAAALGQIGGERALETLLQRIDPLGERDYRVRWWVNAALGQIGGEGALNALLPRIDSVRESATFASVRSFVVAVIGKIGGERALNALLPRLDPKRESDGRVRESVAAALGQIGGERALEALLPRLHPAREKDGNVRVVVAAALGKIGEERACDALLPRLHPACEEDENVRRSVAEALGRIGGNRALNALLRGLDPAREEDENVRGSVAEALGQIGGERALNALLPRLDPKRESDRRVRGSVAAALGQIGGERALEVLLPRLYPACEEDEYVREAVAAALGKIGGERARDALLPRLDPARESNRGVRRNVAAALGQIGGDRALEALLPSLHPMRESDRSVRRVVTEALFKLYWRLGDRAAFLLH